MPRPGGLRGAPAAARAQEGYTLVELLAVLVILVTVVTSLTALFVSGARAELEQNRRFQAQLNARLAVDKLRREVHCASDVQIADGGATATVVVPGHCPTAIGAATTNVVYATEPLSAGRYRLTRAGTPVADYLTSGTVFAYAKTPGELGRLTVDLPVNLNPNEGWKQWRLQTDIVLRNTTRT